MSQKERNITALLASDPSGRLQRLHDQLVSIGLKTRMPSNTETLLFEAVAKDKSRHGLAAFRSGSSQVFSFPRTYWARRMSELRAAVANIDRCHFIELEGGFSGSQNSILQVRVTQHTEGDLEAVVHALIASHARRLSEGQ